MSIQAILFGGIGTLAETSELQRAAFNQAFEEHGLDWHWDRQTYRELLSTPGGQKRIRLYASGNSSGKEISDEDGAALHARKTELFQKLLTPASLEPRAGVRNLMNKARNSDVRIAIASTTTEANILALLKACALDPAEFDVIVHRMMVKRTKPDPEVYIHCLELLGIDAATAVAVEDSDSGMDSALAAGVICVALPGANTSSQDFSRAALIVDEATGSNLISPSGRLSGLDFASCERLVATIR